MGSITLKQVTKSFGDVNVIKPLDLHIRDGEFIVFVGPSGCGKSVSYTHLTLPTTPYV